MVEILEILIYIGINSLNRAFNSLKFYNYMLKSQFLLALKGQSTQIFFSLKRSPLMSLEPSKKIITYTVKTGQNAKSMKSFRADLKYDRK